MKLTTKDINIMSKGSQIKKLVLEKYDSLDDFLEENNINLYSNSLESYMKRKEIPSKKFIKIIEKVFGKPYDQLLISEEQQIEGYVRAIYENMDLYIENDSHELIEYLRETSVKKNLWISASKLYRILSIESYNSNNLPLAIEYIKIAIDFADYQMDNSLLADYYFDLLCIYSFINDYTNALEISKKIEKILLNTSNKDDYRFFLLYYFQGQIFKSIGNYDRALTLYNNALNCTSNNHDICRIYLLIGTLYMLQSNYYNASEYIQKSIILAKAYSIEITGLSYFIMAEIENKLHSYEQSLENLKKALSSNNDDLQVFFAVPYIELLIMKNESEAAVSEISSKLEILASSVDAQISKENIILFTALIIQACAKFNSYEIFIPLKAQIISYFIHTEMDKANLNDIELTFIGYLYTISSDNTIVYNILQKPIQYSISHILLDFTEAYANNKYKPHIIYKYY